MMPTAPGGATAPGNRTIVSPTTFVVTLLVIVGFLLMSQPRRENELSLLQLHLKDDPDVEESRARDGVARLARLDFNREKALDPRQDQRGWMIDPIAAAEHAGLAGGATSCLVAHLGEVLPGKTRGNHRHHLYNETIVYWGAKMRIRNENSDAPGGFGEVTLGPSEVAVMTGPQMQAHAITNVDPHQRTAYLVACQDGIHDPKNPETDYKIWPDLVK